MAYCTSTEVIALTGTPLSTTEVEDIIAIADEEIDARLAREGLSISEDAPVLVGIASLYLSSALVLERQRADGTMPDSTRVGELTIRAKLEGQIAEYRMHSDQLLMTYMAAQKDTCAFVRTPQHDSED